MDSTLKAWIDEGVSRGARWLIIGWDAFERDWTRHYSSSASPAPYRDGLDSEIFRVDLTIDPAIAASHVFLGEEP